MVNWKKRLTLTKSYLRAKLAPSLQLTHIFITDNCNLSCGYCHVKGNSDNPSSDDVKKWINHAADLGTAMLSFMGGEPLLRSDLSELVQSASQRDLVTYLTTNGLLLDDKIIDSLAEADLDVLELSVDGYNSLHCSEKTLAKKEHLIDLLLYAREKHGIYIKFHQVLHPETIGETERLLSLSQRRKIPISFGLACGVNLDRNLDLEETLAKLATKITANPQSYFTGALQYLREGVNLKCPIGRYLIHVAPNGEILECSVAGKETTEKKFLDIDRSYFSDNKHPMPNQQYCQEQCFSACAYSVNHYSRSGLDFVRQHLK